MGSSSLIPPPPSVVVPGNHDGVHRGHQALLSHARRLADRLGGARVLALTFDPHPLALLAPERVPEPLTTIERRVTLLERAGADEVVVARFDAPFAQLSAEDFVAQELVGRLGARAVVVGADYRFGHGRTGDVAFLRAAGARQGFELDVIDTVAVDERDRVSSTLVREALRRGDVGAAAGLLARPHELEGVVVEGHRRGRTLGFPTANLDGSRTMLPRDGVYAVLARVIEPAGQGEKGALCLGGMLNVGSRPTFGAGRSVEVHLFDVSRDLYGATLRLGLVSRLRDEQRFSGLDALVSQLGRDALDARAALAALPRALLTSDTLLA